MSQAINTIRFEEIRRQSLAGQKFQAERKLYERIESIRQFEARTIAAAYKFANDGLDEGKLDRMIEKFAKEKI